MSTTIIEALFEYFAACPLITDNRLNIDYLPEDTSQAGVEYSIGTTPANEVVRQYKDGGQLCRYVFVITGVNDCAPGAAQNMLNSGFYEVLALWLGKQSRMRKLPDLPDGLSAQRIKAVGPGYLYAPDINSGKYQIQCELEYYRKGDINV